MSPESGPKRRRRLYLDTSAYLGLLVGEPRALAIGKETADADVFSSALLVLEARRNLIRLAREQGISTQQYAACMGRVEQDIERFTLRELTLDLCGSRPIPPIATPRSLDLAHLRTALWFHETDPLDRFVTLDAAQAEAAREFGLPA